MPIYEYRCKKCGNRFELIQRYSDTATPACPECGTPSEREMSAPSFQFKGSGWYITDYSHKNSPQPSKAKADEGGAASPKKENDTPSI